MIEQRFERVEHWQRWRSLLAAWPDSRVELESKMLVILGRIESTSGLGDPLLRAMERTDVSMGLSRAVVEPEPDLGDSRPRMFMWAVAVAASAVLGIGVGMGVSTSVAPTEMRGASPVESSEAWLWRDGRPIGSVHIGGGLRPTLQAGGEVRVESSGDERVLGWSVGSEQFFDLRSGWTASPESGDTWVLAVLDADAEPRVVADMVGRGDSLVVGWSGGQFVFVDWK